MSVTQGRYLFSRPGTALSAGAGAALWRVPHPTRWEDSGAYLKSGFPSKGCPQQERALVPVGGGEGGGGAGSK